MYLLVIKVLKSDRHFIFALLIEDNFEGACVIVNLKEGPHGLLLLCSHTSHNNDLKRQRNEVSKF